MFAASNLGFGLTAATSSAQSAASSIPPTAPHHRTALVLLTCASIPRWEGGEFSKVTKKAPIPVSGYFFGFKLSGAGACIRACRLCGLVDVLTAEVGLIAEGLLDLLPTTRLMVIDGAGHMGPLTHTAKVCALIKGHILDADERCAARTLAPRPETIELSGSSALSFAAVHQSVFATSTGR
jgi:hypothetical protein